MLLTILYQLARQIEESGHMQLSYDHASSAAGKNSGGKAGTGIVTQNLKEKAQRWIPDCPSITDIADKTTAVTGPLKLPAWSPILTICRRMFFQL